MLRLVGGAFAAVGLLIVGCVVADMIWHRYDDDGLPRWVQNPHPRSGLVEYGSAVIGQ